MRAHPFPRPTTPIQPLCCAPPVLILLCSLPILSAGGLVAQERPTFATTVELVQFQVQLKNAGEDGPAILTAEDFVLEVDGEPREIALVYPVQPGWLAEDDGGAGSVPAAAWDQYLFLFDAVFNTGAGLRRAQEAAATMIRDELQPWDLAAVAVLTPTQGLRLVVPFTFDRRQVLVAIGELGVSRVTRRGDRAGFLSALLEERPASVDTEDEDDRPGRPRVSNQELLQELGVQLSGTEVQRSVSTSVSWAEQLEMLARWLRSVRGPKSVILFTGGIADELLAGGAVEQINSETRFGSASVRSALDQVATALRGVQATLHVVDPTSEGRGRATSGKTSQQLLADGTGGSVVPIRRVTTIFDEPGTVRYVIGFPRLPGDGEGLAIRLRVTVPGIEIVSAPDRFVPPPAVPDMESVEQQLQLAEIVSKNLDPGGLRFSAVAVPWLPGSAEGEPTIPLPIVIELPRTSLDELTSESPSGELQLEFLLYLLRPNESMVDIANHGLGIRLAPVPGGQIGAPVRVMASLTTPPGEHRVRIIVREATTGKIGARTLSIDVPDPRAVRLQRPVSVLLESRHSGIHVLGTGDTTSPEPSPSSSALTLGGRLVAPAGDQEAIAGESFRLLVQVAGFDPHPVTGRPQGSLRLFLDGEDGRTALEVRILATEWIGTTLRAVIQARLPSGLRPIPTDLILEATDPVSGRARESRLTILPASGSDL